MIRRLIYFFLLIVLLFSIAKAEIYVTSDGHKFEVNLIADKQEIMTNEPIYLSFEIINHSNVDLTFTDGGDYRNRLGRPESYKITSIRNDGYVVPVPKIDISFGGLVGFRKIAKNGGKAIIRLFLPLWSPFEKKGEYEVKCERALNIKDAKDNPLASDRYLSKDTSTPISVRTRIKVVPNDIAKISKLTKYWSDKLLNKESITQSNEAFKALEYIGGKEVVRIFINALKSKETFFNRESAMLFLAKTENKEAFEAIISQINNESNSIRSSTVLALSFSKNPKTLDYILKLKDDPDKYVRLQVLLALGRINTEKSLSVLRELSKKEKNKEFYEFIEVFLKKTDK